MIDKSSLKSWDQKLGHKKKYISYIFFFWTKKPQPFDIELSTCQALITCNLSGISSSPSFFFGIMEKALNPLPHDAAF